MAGDPAFFRDLALVLVAAVLGGVLAWRTGQPLVLGYVLGGMAISPFTPGPAVASTHNFEAFAEIGVVLLMFSVGLEFSLKDLLRVKRVALFGGTLGTALSIGLTMAVGFGLGWPSRQGLVVGVVISVASTMVLARLLLDRGELHTRHGRVLIGMSLVEDLAVVVLLALMPALGALAADRLLLVGRGLGIAALVLIPFVALAARVVSPLLTRVARTRDQELFLLVALAIGLGTAALTQAVGLSLALGAFLAGLLISTSDFAHETLARLLPLRDTFGAFFFVTVGALIDPRSVVANLPLLATLVVLVVVGKLIVRFGLVWLFGETLWTALLTGIGLAQIGEFSFVLVQAARQAGHIGPDIYQATLAASLLTIVINAAMVRLAPRYLGALRAAGRATPESDPAAHELVHHVILCGFGRVGSAVAEALDTFHVRWIAIETDPDIVRGLRERGIPSLFGDASHRRLLEHAGAERAALVVVALPESQHVQLVVRRLRALNATVPILARAHAREHHEPLLLAGATEVIQPEMEAASTLIRHALRRLALPRERVLAYLEQYREAMELVGPHPVEGGLPQLREVTLEAGALTDRTLHGARVRERFGVSVITITRADGTLVPHPAADTMLRSGDRVRLFGLPEQIDALLAHAARRE
ncbi:MAG TPA: cation:proton antiporter [Methylomirabilota bacterium]|jgi:CPA2 family monovalent cation:H+ antiporter-2|nr:cation:proton antiporter [Methylomirabilota bacterium]